MQSPSEALASNSAKPNPASAPPFPHPHPQQAYIESKTVHPEGDPRNVSFSRIDPKPFIKCK